jgi:hypothetical protein
MGDVLIDGDKNAAVESTLDVLGAEVIAAT